MSATEILRRLLDEREVEWDDDGYPTTCTVWVSDGVTWHGLWRDDCIELIAHLTPKQAIAATLGSCNCPNNCTNGERTETCEADETDLIPDCDCCLVNGEHCEISYIESDARELGIEVDE